MAMGAQTMLLNGAVTKGKQGRQDKNDLHLSKNEGHAELSPPPPVFAKRTQSDVELLGLLCLEIVGLFFSTRRRLTWKRRGKKTVLVLLSERL